MERIRTFDSTYREIARWCKRHRWNCMTPRHLNFWQYFSHGVAAEGSPRREPWDWGAREKRAAARRKNVGKVVLVSPLPGLEGFTPFPRLTPWATFWRCSAAI